MTEHLMGTMNQIATLYNPYQGRTKKVLFVCSAGILRSPTAARVFSQEPYNWNTRSTGAAPEFALVPTTLPLILWADQIYLMEDMHMDHLEKLFGDKLGRHRNKMHVLNIPDNYAYFDEELIKILKETVDAHIDSQNKGEF